MAAKSKRTHPTGKVSGKGKGKTARSAAASSHELIRHARVGRRTTLRVPPALEAEVARTAKELEISENEALIRLAKVGALTAKRQRDVREVVARRHAAVSGAASEAEQRAFPSPGDMQAAILVDRD
jgi:hypothetical protein